MRTMRRTFRLTSTMSFRVGRCSLLSFELNRVAATPWGDPELRAGNESKSVMYRAEAGIDRLAILQYCLLLWAHNASSTGLESLKSFASLHIPWPTPQIGRIFPIGARQCRTARSSLSGPTPRLTPSMSAPKSLRSSMGKPFQHRQLLLFNQMLPKLVSPPGTLLQSSRRKGIPKTSLKA